MKKKNICDPPKGEIPSCELAPEPDNEYTRALNETAKKIFAICDEFNKKFDPWKLYISTEDELQIDMGTERKYRVSADFTSYVK